MASTFPAVDPGEVRLEVPIAHQVPRASTGSKAHAPVRRGVAVEDHASGCARRELIGACGREGSRAAVGPDERAIVDRVRVVLRPRSCTLPLPCWTLRPGQWSTRRLRRYWPSAHETVVALRRVDISADHGGKWAACIVLIAPAQKRINPRCLVLVAADDSNFVTVARNHVVIASADDGFVRLPDDTVVPTSSNEAVVIGSAVTLASADDTIRAAGSITVASADE